MKIWLCGQVAGKGEIENIKEICSLNSYFDGLCWTVNYQKEDFSDDDGTYLELNKHKKEGKILRSNWVNVNSLGMTMALQCGAIKFGDWVLFIDGNEIPKKEFLQNMRENFEKWDKEEVYSMWWGRPYAFRFFPEMTFQPTSCHCMVNPIIGKAVSIQDEAGVWADDGGTHFSNFIYNKKKKENSMLLHGVKYCLFNVSNQMQMFYPKNTEYTEHEAARRSFCKLLDEKGYKRDLAGLEEFFSKKDNLTDEIIDYLNWEHVFNSFFRYRFMGHSIDEIMIDRYTYKLSKDKMLDKIA